MNALFIPTLRDKTNQKFKAAKKLSAVTESLLPFINGPPRLKLVNQLLAGMIKGPRRYSGSLSPPILSRPRWYPKKFQSESDNRSTIKKNIIFNPKRFIKMLF